MRRAVIVCAIALLLNASRVCAAEINPDGLAQATVQALIRAYQAAHSFQGHIRVALRKRQQVDVRHMAIWLEKPSGTALKVLSSTAEPSTEGTKVIWHGEATCQVKAKFFGFPLKPSAAFDDPRLGSIRGWNFRESSIAALMRMIADPRTTVRVVGKDTVVGRPMTLIEARGPLLLPGTDREIV